MKRIISTIMLSLMLSISAFSQKTVAVYVTSSEDVPQQTSKILGSELVAAITRNADYIAVERTADFMAQVTEEQGRYNNIDDTKLFELGRKYGASNVCVADITKYGDEYYIVARLLDIRTSRVWRTSKKYAKLASLRELVETSEALANELFGNLKEFSTYAYGDNMDNNSYIVRIENRGSYTKVTLKYVSVYPQQKLGINRETYIEDMTTGQKFQLTDAVNVNILDQSNTNGKTIGTGIWEYSLFFDRIPEDAQTIRMVEPGGRKYNDIVLRPYGDENIFVFEDKTQGIYDNKSFTVKEQLKEQGNVVINKRGNTYYMGDQKITKDEYKGLIEDCPEAWAKYKKGKIWNTVGWACAIGGVAIFVVSLNEDGYRGETSIEKFEKDRAMIRFTAVGLCLLSIPEFIIGNYNKHEAYKEYNKYCSKPATLSLGITSNGGVGVTLSF